MKGLVMKYKFLCCFILLVIGLSPMTLAYSTSYSWSVLDSSIETSAQSSVNVQNDNFLNLDAESAILIEQNSGQILYSHNIHEKLHPASVTKIMSLLLLSILQFYCFISLLVKKQIEKINFVCWQ